MFCWLGSFLDGSSRVKQSHPAAGSKRVRRCLEPAPWFCDRLQQQGGEGFAQTALYNLHSRPPADDLKVCALVKLSSRGCVFDRGSITQWNREAHLQRSYYEFPADGYTLHIENVLSCVTAPAIVHKRSRVCGLGGFGKIDRSHPLFVAHWGRGDGDAEGLQSSAEQVVLNTDAGRQMFAQQVLDASNSGCKAGDLPVILLPWPIAYLVTKGSWSTVFLLLRWHSTLHQHRHRRSLGPLPNWPPADAEIWQRVGTNEQVLDADELSQAEPLNPDTLERFSSTIRGWAPHLLGHRDAPQPDPAVVQQDLQSILRTLDVWSFSWRQAMGMVNLPGGGSRFRHSSRKLLDCIRLSSLLKGGPSSLVQVVAQSLSTVLPEFMREPFLRNLLRRGDGSSQLLPSASLIGRYEIALDVALMLLTKQRAVQKCVRVGWTDSSPLAGYDWIWSQYHEIPESKLIPCFLAVNRLSDAISAFVAEQEEREEGNRPAHDDDDDEAEGAQVWPTMPCPDWKPWLSIIQESIHEHIHPPAALGSGRRSLADKAASEVYKWQLQSPKIPDLSDHSASYVAHCSDMGVELSLPDFEMRGAVESLLPEWLRDSAMLQPDIDACEHEAPVDSCCDNDGVDGPLLDDVDCVDEGPVAPVPANPDVQPEPVADPPRAGVHFLPNAFPVAGMQHVVNNLCADVHQGMCHWKAFHAELKALEALLRIDERRQRFIWTCLHDTNLEGLSFRFRKFSGSLYEGRWHQVIMFLKQLKPLLSILARAWSKDKFIRGVNANGLARPAQAQAEQVQQERQGLTALDPDKITSAVGSALFHAYVEMALKLEEIPEGLASNSESCVCHRRLLQHMSAHKRRKCLEEHYDHQCSVCPMAGKLLPELVAGDLEAAFEAICSMQETHLRLMPLPGLAPLTASDWNTLISDFRAGGQMVQFC